MNFPHNNPGAVQYGNFINYYQFNPAIERLKLLPTHVWLEDKNSTQTTFSNSGRHESPYLVLDVGCNCGDLTQLLWKFLSEHVSQPVLILGIDIDKELIARAEAKNNKEANISFATVDITEAKDFVVVENFLHKYQRLKFDAVCCFSITMWIHLNHHDCGLHYFLRKLSSMAELFVVEPQPWKCYQTAQRRMRKAGKYFPLLSELKWRSTVDQEIQAFIENLGRRMVYQCYPTNWNRRICFYR